MSHPSDELARAQLVLDSMPALPDVPTKRTQTHARHALERWILRFDCPRCKQPRGEWCRTRSGNIATYLHGVREEWVTDVFWDGFENGWRSRAEQIEQQAAS